jgi:hypothetical protein
MAGLGRQVTTAGRTVNREDSRGADEAINSLAGARVIQ